MNFVSTNIGGLLITKSNEIFNVTNEIDNSLADEGFGQRFIPPLENVPHANAFTTQKEPLDYLAN